MKNQINIENDIKYNFSPDIYDKIYKKTSQLQRINADWYVAKLAIKAIKRGQKERAYLLIDNFIKDEFI